MMLQIYSFIGEHERQGALIYVNGHRLLISRRQNPTNKKTEYFMLDKTDNRGKYMSGLYPMASTPTQKQYSFDYNGQKYVLTMLDAKVKIDYLTKPIAKV
jgi:hypothetical protein